MSLLAFQSPLSILGLKYAENNKDAVNKAYRIALLHCHPDKNRNPFIPATYYDLVREAYKWLGLRQPIEQFKGYPVLFSPQATNIGQPTVFKIPTSSQFTVCECGAIPSEQSTCGTPGCEQSIQQDFKVCIACKTAILVYRYEVHISDHKDLCPLCGILPDKDHYQDCHPEAICPLCAEVNLNGHIESHVVNGCSICCSKFNKGDDLWVNHVRQEHLDCPLCKRKCGDDFNEHLWEVHHFEPDESCIGCREDVLSHYLSSHKWLRCPYSKCDLDIAIAHGNLWAHAKANHQLRRCPACPTTEEGFAGDRTHAEAHELAICPVCMKQFPSYDLPQHQVSKHSWLLCTYCNLAEKSEEMLQQHVREDHLLVKCSVCQQPHLKEKINIHLSEAHGWMKCSWCNEAFTEEELREHITVSHPPQESCACRYRDTIPGLKIHRVDVHGWQQCPYCEKIEPPDQFEQHINKHQLTACQECNMSFLPEKESAHFQEQHQYMQCPFCEYFDSQVNMLVHIPIHLNQPLLPLPAPGIPGQSQEVEPVKRGHLGKRKLSFRKCNSCRERKIKCTFKNRENTCDQCLDSVLTCPGSSYKTERLRRLGDAARVA